MSYPQRMARYNPPAAQPPVPKRIVERFDPGRLARYNPPAANVVTDAPVEQVDTPRRLARYNPPAAARTPAGDERLSGDGGAELGARRMPKPPAMPADAHAPAPNSASDTVDDLLQTTPATRPRYATGTQLERDEQTLRDLETSPVRDENGALKSVGLGALNAGAAGARSGSLGFALGSMLGGGASALLDKSRDEKLQRQQDIITQSQRVSDDRAAEHDRLARDASVAATNLKNTQADDVPKKRDEADAKAAASAAAAQKRTIFSNLKLFRGTKLDANNPTHLALLQRAADAGIEVDPEAWNDDRSNVVPVTITDPNDPTRTRQIFWNKVTGSVAANFQKGYQQPVNASGMTTTQERTDADRDAARVNAERQRGVQNALARARIGQGNQRLDLARAAQDKSLDKETRTEAAAAAKLRSEAERWQEAANAIGSRTKYKDPVTGEEKESGKALNKRDEYAARAASLRQQLMDTHGYMWASPDGAGGPTMGVEQFKSLFPNLGGNFTGEAQRLGVTISDAGAMQGPVHRSPLQRAAPARSSAAPASTGGGAQFGEDEIRARARAKGKSEDAAVEAARRAGLLRP